MKEKVKQSGVLHFVLVGVVLLLVIIGGGTLILYDPIWTLDDATIIQSTVGSGRMMHVYDEPGFAVQLGRFFPLAYMHTNLVLLFTEGYISAKPFFCPELFPMGWLCGIVVLFDLLRVEGASQVTSIGGRGFFACSACYLPASAEQFYHLMGDELYGTVVNCIVLRPVFINTVLKKVREKECLVCSQF